MATLSWSFLRPKPKPPKPALSAFVRRRLDEMYKESGEPSEELRDDFRRYVAIRARVRRAA